MKDSANKSKKRAISQADFKPGKDKKQNPPIKLTPRHKAGLSCVLEEPTDVKSLSEEQQSKILSNFNSPRRPSIPAASPRPDSIADTKESTCLICFDNKPNAVYMPCGHGGICYVCAMELWKKADECYLCRNHIERLLKIDLQALEGNTVRILAQAQMHWVDEHAETEEY